MGDVTRRWPRLHPVAQARVERAERDAATVAALEAYLRDAGTPERREVDVRL